MSLQCPACQHSLNEVRAPATTGYCLLLDQCPQCGGVWCDKWELYPLSTEAARQIDPAGQGTVPAEPPQSVGSYPCPRCSVRMKPFVDPSLPATVRIARCSRCEGMWLCRGQLRLVKRQSQAIRPTESRLSERDLHADSWPPGEWPAIAHLDTALNPAARDDEQEDGESPRSGVWIVLRLLLQWLLGI
ncbi:MAG: zf-TFIIB domain-containing protein [Deltaproteobacteria bacterium]|nr:zf-TFIIB domain-containing protein [Deltaproteobacteria bacterium]